MPLMKIGRLLAPACAAFFVSQSAAEALDCSNVGYVQAQGGYYKASDHSGPYSLDSSCNPTLIGSGGGGGAINLTQWNSVNLGGPSAYGVAPSGNVPGFNGFITNLNPNGQTAMSGSSPVAIASDQSPIPTVGNVAGGTTDSGNPIKIGGIFNAAFPTYTAGQRTEAQYDSKGGLFVALKGANSGSNIVGATNNTGGQLAASQIGINTSSVVYQWNGTNFDPITANTDTAALSTFTAAGASTVNSADQTNPNGRGVQIGINLTTMTTATVTVNIQGKDKASGVYYTILSSAALVATGFTNMTVYPGAATTANASSPQPLPRVWRVQTVIVGGSAAVTGTVGASVVN